MSCDCSFDNYEGFKEKAKIDERLERAAAWFKVMKVCPYNTA